VKILVLGSGGREHALAWRLSRDPAVTELLAAPGNPGMAAVARTLPVDLDRPGDVLALAEAEDVDLTIVGPEAPLDRGVADVFRARGRAILGPSRAAAQLECSKVFSKTFMARHGIPTARFVVCDSADEAIAAVLGGHYGPPVVVKADGLAAGKGVVVAQSTAEAEAAIRAMMLDRVFADAGRRVVIEECLTGPEVSCFVLADGQRAVVLGTAQDHKRIWDDDRGPNTGGMGAFAPSPLFDDALADFTMRKVVEPVMKGLAAEGESYRGFLYVSLMLTPDGPRVIEFNVRFGDPEAQVVLPLIEGPIAQAFFDAATGALTNPRLTLADDKTVGVVAAAAGYPSKPASGAVITGLDEAAAVPGALVFHAGTKRSGDNLVTAGGRVLTIAGRGPTFEAAMATAYQAVSAVHFDGMQYRKDIGRRALASKRASSQKLEARSQK
jgi:phosphoribosylamine--glycine ligase